MDCCDSFFLVFLTTLLFVLNYTTSATIQDWRLNAVVLMAAKPLEPVIRVSSSQLSESNLTLL